MSLSSQISVLLIEDDPEDALLIRRAFKRSETLRVNVEESRTLLQGIENLENRDYDIVLLDLSLPDSTGVSSIKRIIQCNQSPAIVVLTGLDDDAVAEQALEAGAHEYLVKSEISSSLLRRVVRYAIERNRLRLALESRVVERTEALRVSSERFRILVDAVIDYAIFMLDEDCRVSSWNKGAQRITGYSRTEVVGQALSTIFQDIDANKINQWLGEARSDGRTSFELELKTKSGESFNSQWILSILESKEEDAIEKEVRGYAVVLRDITALRAAQKRALSAERLAAIGEMVTGLAHESRNALQRIQASVNRLVRKLSDRADCLEIVEYIEQAGDDLKQLYDTVKQYAAPVAQTNNSAVIVSVWNETISDFQSGNPDSTISFNTQISNSELEHAIVVIDPFHLKQIFQNIIENAAAANPTCELRLRLATSEYKGKDGILLSVSDNGPGIEKEKFETIFAPFHTSKTKGTGLGLAITRRLVQEHAGWIGLKETWQLPQRFEIEGLPGADFFIFLPKTSALEVRKSKDKE